MNVVHKMAIFRGNSVNKFKKNELQTVKIDAKEEISGLGARMKKEK